MLQNQEKRLICMKDLPISRVLRVTCMIVTLLESLVSCGVESQDRGSYWRLRLIEDQVISPADNSTVSIVSLSGTSKEPEVFLTTEVANLHPDVLNLRSGWKKCASSADSNSDYNLIVEPMRTIMNADLKQWDLYFCSVNSGYAYILISGPTVVIRFQSF